MFRRSSEFIRPQVRASFLWRLPWIGAFGWAAVTAVRSLINDRFDSASFLGGVVGAAVAGFVVAAVLAMALAAVLFLLSPVISVLSRGKRSDPDG